MAASRQISKAAPDSDGAAVRTIGAIPAAGAETGGVSVAPTFDGRLVGLGGTARGGEAGGVKLTGILRGPGIMAQTPQGLR
jgi:hypothetical protein